MRELAVASRRRHWQLRIGIAAIVVVAAAGIYGRIAGSAPTAAVDNAASIIEIAPIEVTTAEPRTLLQTVSLAGSLRAFDLANVRAEVAARVIEVPVREGDVVTRGQVLARLATKDLKTRLDEKEGLLREARANLDYAEKTRAKDIILHRDGFASQTVMDQAESNYQAGVATVAAAQAQVDLATKALADAAVLSPFDGVLARRQINVGDYAGPDQASFVVADLSRIEVEASVPAGQIPLIRVGQEAVLAVEGFGDRRFAGAVERINPVATTGSRSISVYLILANPDRALRGGMFADGEIVIDRRDNAIGLPVEAIRHDGAGDYVLAVAQGKVMRLAIARGPIQTADGLVEIARGVSAGETVVTAPLQLTDGTAVKLING